MDRILDLPLRRNADHLEKLANRHIEPVFVHTGPSAVDGLHLLSGSIILLFPANEESGSRYPHL